MARSLASIFCLILLISATAWAQQQFHAVLINSLDSSIVPNAAVSIREIEKTILTDSAGRFHCALPATQKELTIAVAAIGCKTTITYHRTFQPLEKVYVEIMSNTLSDFTFVGLSAEDVVREAVRRIPQNYADSSYFCPSSYRQYQCINGQFRNLIEAKPVVMFQLRRKKGRIDSKEAYAVTHLRRTSFVFEPGHPYSNNAAHLLQENPVYHLEQGSLNPFRFSKYRFAFDTSVESDSFYVIRYFINDFSLEKHGVENLSDAFRGESYEKGEIKIERSSFAIMSMHRTAYRYRNYEYPRYNNFVWPERKYYMELRDGALSAQYTKRHGKWYLDRLVHQFTNDYYHVGWTKLDFVVTCNFEWQCDSVTRYTTDEYRNRFYPEMRSWHLPYDSAYWASDNFPFYWHKKEEVYNGLANGSAAGPVFISNFTGADSAAMQLIAPVADSTK